MADLSRVRLQNLCTLVAAGRLTSAVAQILQWCGSNGEIGEVVQLLEQHCNEDPPAVADLKARIERIRGPLHEALPHKSPKASELFARLFHFTSELNLPSIDRHGLLSLRLLDERRIPYTPSSSQDSRGIDRYLDHDLYIPLCRQKAHRMATFAVANRDLKLVWIEVDPVVLDSRPSRYSDTNAVSRRAHIDMNPQTALQGDDQAEILVKGHIQRQYLTIPGK